MVVAKKVVWMNQEVRIQKKKKGGGTGARIAARAFNASAQEAEELPHSGALRELKASLVSMVSFRLDLFSKLR